MKKAAALLLLLLVILFAWRWAREPVDTLYFGGPILSMDSDDRVVEALLVVNGRIAAMGKEAWVRDAAAAGIREVDLAGRALLPGFIDAHGHFPGAGIFEIYADLNSPPIGNAERFEDVFAALARKVVETAAGSWVIGMGYDDTLLAEKRHPTRRDLDRVSRDHPIAAWHISGHLLSLNSLGLERLGITADTPDPEGGVIRREAETGEPDGVLEESATEFVNEGVPPPSLWQGLAIAREASRRYASEGVTTAQSGYTAGPLMHSLHWLVRLGVVPLRLVLWPSMEVADAMLSGDFEFASWDEEWVKSGAVKLIADGSIQGYTGYLSRPYHVPPGDDAGYRGYPRISREELFERVLRYHAAGLQVAVHGNGDASIDDILDALENAQRAHPREDARPVVIHAQMARDDQLDRMKRLGGIPSFFSLHTYYWGDRHRDIFMGPERAARMSPARSAVESDLRFTIHADCPVVPMEPLRLVWSAVNRRSASGAAIGDAQRIDAMAALRAVTIDAAHQHFEENLKGSLEPGKLADLVILSESPLERPERIDRIRVIETIVGGRSIYRSDAAANGAVFK